SAAICDLRSVRVCRRPAGSAFCIDHAQTGGCRLGDQPVADAAFVKQHRGCRVIRNRLVDKTCDSCGRSWLVPSLTNRSRLWRYEAVAEADSRDAFGGDSASRATPIATSTAEPPQYPARSLT